MEVNVFSRKEYIRRLERAYELMEANDFDALFISGEENYTYFTGAKSLVPWLSFTRPVFVIIPLRNEPVVITHSALLEDTRKSSRIGDVRVYSSRDVPLGRSPVNLLVEVFREKGLSKGRIGAELGYEQRLGFPFLDFIKLKKALSDVDFVDASSLLWRLRMIKSAEEIAFISKACEVTGRARQRCFSEIEAGMTEREVARLFFKFMFEEGADKGGFVHIVSGSLSESTMRPTDKPLRKGETLYIDGGCYIRDYTCDYSRIATIGVPSDEQVKLHEIICEVNRKMIELYKPGTRTSKIARVCLRELKKKGFLLSGVGRVGHGQGMLITEPPSVSELDDTVLEPGMVVSSEPYIITDHDVFIWEDVIAIREDGCEILTEGEPTELVTI